MILLDRLDGRLASSSHSFRMFSLNLSNKVGGEGGRGAGGVRVRHGMGRGGTGSLQRKAYGLGGGGDGMEEPPT